MTKAQRQKVFDKFGGRCAYTGKPLGDDWQVDHMYCALETIMLQRERDCFENLLPTLKIVNHYKRGLIFNHWRERIATLHERLAKLPACPRVDKSKKTKAYILEVAAAFDITIDKPFSGKFYFERLTENL